MTQATNNDGNQMCHPTAAPYLSDICPSCGSTDKQERAVCANSWHDGQTREQRLEQALRRSKPPTSPSRDSVRDVPIPDGYNELEEIANMVEEAWGLPESARTVRKAKERIASLEQQVRELRSELDKAETRVIGLADRVSELTKSETRLLDALNYLLPYAEGKLGREMPTVRASIRAVEERRKRAEVSNG